MFDERVRESREGASALSATEGRLRKASPEGGTTVARPLPARAGNRARQGTGRAPEAVRCYTSDLSSGGAVGAYAWLSYSATEPDRRLAGRDNGLPASGNVEHPTLQVQAKIVDHWKPF